MASTDTALSGKTSVHLVSYLSGSGYTLTTRMNLETERLHGFASNDKEWYPLTGTLEP